MGAADSDIDHVVIGPAGVFTLNTKNHTDKSVWVAERTLMVSGRKQNHIRNSVHEAARASKLLSAATELDVPVAAVIVLVGTKSLNIKKAPTGATVLTSQELGRWLGKRMPALSAEAMSAVVAAANQPGTWHQAPRDAGNSADLQSRFERVHSIVRQARRRRVTWGFAGMGVFVLTLLTAAFSMAPALVGDVFTAVVNGARSAFKF